MDGVGKDRTENLPDLVGKAESGERAHIRLRAAVANIRQPIIIVVPCSFDTRAQARKEPG